MVEAVYVLCGITSIICATLLFRGYRESRTRLLFWSSCCFAGLAVNNVFLVVNLVLIDSIDFGMVRTVSAVIAMAVLVFGLVWEAR